MILSLIAVVFPLQPESQVTLLYNGWLKASKCTSCIHISFQDPFEVGFVQTTFTVSEDEGAVEVCVTLIKPLEGVGDERVNVEVFDFSSSMYIPLGVAHASESNLWYYAAIW